MQKYSAAVGPWWSSPITKRKTSEMVAINLETTYPSSGTTLTSSKGCAQERETLIFTRIHLTTSDLRLYSEALSRKQIFTRSPKTQLLKSQPKVPSAPTILLEPEPSTTSGISSNHATQTSKTRPTLGSKRSCMTHMISFWATKRKQARPSA